MKFWISICILAFSCSIFGEILKENINNRERRTIPKKFYNAHVISPKTFNQLSKSPDPATHYTTYLTNMSIKNNNLMLRLNPQLQGSTPHNYDQRKSHTLIVGSRKDVAESVRNGKSLPEQGSRAGSNNLVESNEKFQQLQINRFPSGPNKGKISSINNLNKRHFAAAVDNNKLPVHYQANYVKNGPMGTIQVNNVLGGVPIFNNPINLESKMGTDRVKREGCRGRG